MADGVAVRAKKDDSVLSVGLNVEKKEKLKSILHRSRSTFGGNQTV